MRLKNKVYFFLLFLSSCITLEKPEFKYPSIEPNWHKEVLHGVEIKDPYRNIENLNDTLVRNWFKKQGELTDSALSKIKFKDSLLAKMIALDRRTNENLQYYRFNKDGSYFYVKPNESNQSNSFYYRENKESTEVLVLDPELYKSGWIISYFKPSWDLSKIAFALTPKGEKNSDLIIYDMKTESFLPDKLTGVSPMVAGGIEWLPDNSGFLHLDIPHFNYNDPSYLLNTKTKLYSLTNDSINGITVFSKETSPNIAFKKGDFPLVKVINLDNAYLVGEIRSVADFSNTYHKPLDVNHLDAIGWKLLFSEDEKIDHYFIVGDYLIYRTAKNAPNYKICRVLLNQLDFENAEVLVSEYENEVINDFEPINGKILFTTLKNGVFAQLREQDRNGMKTITMPEPSGSISISRRGKFTLITSRGWLSPRITYHYDDVAQEFINVGLSDVKFPEFKDIIVEEVEVESHDGVLVPLSIIYNRNLVKNGKNRTLMISYGSYGTSYSPSFSIQRQVWVTEGGVVALAHVRGGGEKGNDWHMDGFKVTKPNTWKDLIACTEYLIQNNYSSPDYMINRGVSAGGISVGRSIIERPDLYAVAIMESPSLNLLRSEFQPNGPNNIPEFGTIKDSIEFKALMEMDSYHNLKENAEYPSTLINVGMKDGQVPSWDPGKYIARLQNMTSTKNPVLMSVLFESGHVGDGSAMGIYKNVSMLYSFALWQTGHPKFQPD